MLIGFDNKPVFSFFYSKHAVISHILCIFVRILRKYYHNVSIANGDCNVNAENNGNK